MPSTASAAQQEDGEAACGSSSPVPTAHQQAQQEANKSEGEASSAIAYPAVAAPNEIGATLTGTAGTTVTTDLDAPYFYYHNDRTGIVSTTALTPRQLISLLAAGILSSTTRIVPISITSDSTGTTTYGEWTTCDQIDLLRHAACLNWYYTTNDETKETQGPVTVKQLSTVQESISMVYAPTVCNEWKAYADYSTLRQVVSVFVQQNVQKQAIPPSLQTTTKTKTAKSKSTADDMDHFEDFLDDESENEAESDDEECYQSDGGTTYVKDQTTGNWVMEALYRVAHPSSKTTNQEESSNKKQDITQPPPSKKQKKDSSSNKNEPKFKKKHAKHWIYVTGLPTTVDKDQVVTYFQKVGLIDLDPLTLQPKVKLYLNENGTPKGDASICYAKIESVELALQILDDSVWDEHHTIHVQKAEFSASTNNHNNKKRTKPTVSTAQRKVAKLALKQAQDDGFGGRLEGGRKGLTIVIVQHMVTANQREHNDNELEAHLRTQAEAFGPVEKITYIASTNTVIYKFVEPTAASAAIRAWHHSTVPTAGSSDDNGDSKKQKMEAFYWDGVTNYTSTAKDEAVQQQEEAQRHEEFGKWLEAQGGEDELPPELRLQVEK